MAALSLQVREAGIDALATGEAATDVRAVFSWSYNCLSEPAARMFRLLGVHPGPGHQPGTRREPDGRTESRGGEGHR